MLMLMIVLSFLWVGGVVEDVGYFFEMDIIWLYNLMEVWEGLRIKICFMVSVLYCGYCYKFFELMYFNFYDLYDIMKVVGVIIIYNY